MAQGINKVILIGNLGKDPVYRVGQNTNHRACTLSIATTTQWKNKETGATDKKTEWHTIILFGILADKANQYLKKGSCVYIEGYISTKKWIDKRGIERCDKEIICEYMQMLRGIENKKSANSIQNNEINEEENYGNKLPDDYSDIPF